jgi:IclR family transcriptional regulator, KDG regulon repressor
MQATLEGASRVPGNLPATREGQRYDSAMVPPLKSVTNAMRVLKSFDAQHREWGVAAERVLEQDAITGRYRLGLAVFDLAGAVPKRFDLHEAVLKPMADLRNGSGETVHVAVLDGREVVYVERLDSPNTMRMFLERGQRSHAHATATGKILLAFLGERERERILKGWVPVKVTEKTCTDLDRLRAELRVVRDRGYSENWHESEMGVISVGAPIRGADGRVTAALSIAGPVDRIEPHHQRFVEAALAAAAHSSHRLGFRPAGASNH